MKDVNVNLDINKTMRETKVRVKIKGMAIYSENATCCVWVNVNFDGH